MLGSGNLIGHVFHHAIEDVLEDGLKWNKIGRLCAAAFLTLCYANHDSMKSS